MQAPHEMTESGCGRDGDPCSGRPWAVSLGRHSWATLALRLAHWGPKHLLMDTSRCPPLFDADAPWAQMGPRLPPGSMPPLRPLDHRRYEG